MEGYRLSEIAMTWLNYHDLMYSWTVAREGSLTNGSVLDSCRYSCGPSGYSAASGTAKKS